MHCMNTIILYCLYIILKINFHNQIELIKNNEFRKRIQDLDNLLSKADLIEKSAQALYSRYQLQINDEQDTPRYI